MEREGDGEGAECHIPSVPPASKPLLVPQGIFQPCAHSWEGTGGREQLQRCGNVGDGWTDGHGAAGELRGDSDSLTKGTGAHRALVGGTVDFPLSAHTAPVPSMGAAAAPQPHWGSASIGQEVAPEGTPWWSLPVQTRFGGSGQLLQAVGTSVVTWALSDHPLLLPASPSWPRRASVSKQ